MSDETKFFSVEVKLASAVQVKAKTRDEAIAKAHAFIKGRVFEVSGEGVSDAYPYSSVAPASDPNVPDVSLSHRIRGADFWLLPGREIDMDEVKEITNDDDDEED